MTFYPNIGLKWANKYKFKKFEFASFNSESHIYQTSKKKQLIIIWKP